MSDFKNTKFSNNVKALRKIPEELKALPQWVAWRLEVRDGKPTKIPVNPKTGGNARVDDPETWGEFALAEHYWQAHKDNGIAGVGFVFSEADPQRMVF